MNWDEARIGTPGWCWCGNIADRIYSCIENSSTAEHRESRKESSDASFWMQQKNVCNFELLNNYQSVPGEDAHYF